MRFKRGFEGGYSSRFSDMIPYSAKEETSVSLFGERLRPKSSGSLPTPRSDHATANMVFLAHLLTLKDLDHHKYLIGSSL